MLLRVHSPVADPEFLKGKYSESFIEEMKRQLTDRISRAMSVEGLSESTIELQLVFAPGTHMEHNSERVTYRRLLITDKSCGVRDFWVKWKRLDGAVAYTVSDDVTSDTILFEIGEDVPQKIREKEYRFLAFNNPDKYQSAMSKKTVTEWRELIKRAIKKGMLTKVDCEPEPAPDDGVSDRLKDLLTSYGIETHSQEEAPAPDDFDSSIVALARAALGADVSEDADDEPAVAEENEPTPETEEPISLPWTDAVDTEQTEEVEAIDEEPDEEIVEAETEEVEAIDEEPAEEIAEAEPEEAEAPEESEKTLTFEEALALADKLEGEPAPVPTPVREEIVVKKVTVVTDNETAPVPEAAPVSATSEFSDDVTKLLEDKIKREMEAKLRLKYEAEARARAEEAAEELRREHERLRLENERLLEIARAAEEDRARHERELAEAEERHKKEEEELRLRIEAQMQREARERDRMAETARLAVLERKRAEEEKRAREAAKAAAQVKESTISETPKETPAPRPEPAREEFLTKKAKLIFRTTPEVNVINRIKDIIEDTLVALGKTDVKMHIRAFPMDATTIGLDIVKMPPSETELLVTIMKALGNARLGISKITVE